MEDLSKFNKTGMRDAYNILKHLEDKKGGKAMTDPKTPPDDELDDEKLDVLENEVEEEEDDEDDDDDSDD